jgi:hypothetical protein
MSASVEHSKRMKLGEVTCPRCGAPGTELVRMPSSWREGFDYNQLMVECLSCHTTPTKKEVEEASGHPIEWAK